MKKLLLIFLFPIILQAQLLTLFGGEDSFYEIYNAEQSATAEVISYFDGGSGVEWTGGTDEDSLTRYGNGAIKIETSGAAVNLTKTFTTPINMSNAHFAFDFYMNNTVNTTSYIYIYSASGGYWDFGGWDETQFNGWGRMDFPKSKFISQGASSWSDINKITIRITSNSGTNYLIADRLLKVDDVVNKGIVVFTFDDGLSSVYDVAYPYMKLYGYKGTAFVYWFLQYMSLPEMREIKNYGWEIAGHDTPQLTTLTIDSAKSRLNSAVDFLQSSKLGSNYTNYAYSGGAYDSAIYEYMSQSYSFAGNVTSWLNPQSPLAQYRINRRSLSGTGIVAATKPYIDKAETNKEILVLGFHAINEGAGTTTTAEFAQLVDYAHSKDIYIVPFINAMTGNYSGYSPSTRAPLTPTLDSLSTNTGSMDLHYTNTVYDSIYIYADATPNPTMKVGATDSRTTFNYVSGAGSYYVRIRTKNAYGLSNYSNELSGNIN